MTNEIRIPDEVVYEVLDGEAIVLNLESGVYYTLNETGTRIWQLLSEHGRVDAVKSAMLEEFETTAEAVEADISKLIDDLREQGLLE